MARLAIVFLLLTVVLVAIAIYVQITASSLSFPISTGTTVITILLPVFAAVNVLYGPVLDRVLSQTRSPWLQQLLPLALQVIQGVLTVIVATLSFEGFLPGQSLDCNLENNWQRLWHNHDGRAIEHIQDAYDCCGLRSVRDRAWPRDHCQDFYNRHSSCVVPWTSAMQRTAGLDFAVAVAVGLVQLAHIALYRLRASPGGRATRGHKRLSHGVEEANPSDRLIEDADAAGDEEEVEDNGSQHTPNRSYGSVNNTTPRIEPTGLGEEGNGW
ncbi:hypothetical protein F5Y15DRAFT_350634 [Xylariaceae sp. FL0016]|nr:hypothetical protein F5Y15DRAFT_350634 [Xylariaceae sp. FL0016]